MRLPRPARHAGIARLLRGAALALPLAAMIAPAITAPALAEPPLPLPRPDGFTQISEAERAERTVTLTRRDAFAAARAGDAAALEDPALAVAAEWLRLVEATPDAQAIKAFLDRHPDWADRERLRARAELDLHRRAYRPAGVLAFFRDDEPTTESGRRALARALIATGDLDRAGEIIAPVYRKVRMDAAGERAFLEAYGAALTDEHHAARATHQLYFDRVKTAERAARRADDAALTARVTFCAAAIRGGVTRAPSADPHIAHCRAEALEKSPLAAARILAAVTDEADDIGPRSRWSLRRQMAREALDAGKPDLAYRVAANHAIGARAQGAEAEAMAGWIALRALGDAKRAYPHFKRLEALATRPITRARAHYWQGRAHDAKNDMVSAVRAYRAAAAEPTTYYGQLAHARLGKTALSLPALPVSDGAERRAFEARLDVRAAHALAGIGERSAAARLAARLARDEDHTRAKLGARLVAELGSASAQVRVGKLASYRGAPLEPYSFPVLDVFEKHGRSVDLAVLHGVARQESLFEEDAGSHVGAQGLMQLMPRTAREVSGQIGERYAHSKLTRDPGYNVRLGARYIEGLDRRFDGSMPMMFAGYNAGPGRVNQWVRRYGDPRVSVEAAVDWVERIPFEETRNYVMRVMENVGVYRARLNDGTAPVTVAEDLLGRATPVLNTIAARPLRADADLTRSASGFARTPPTPRARLEAFGGPAAALVKDD